MLHTGASGPRVHLDRNSCQQPQEASASLPQALSGPSHPWASRGPSYSRLLISPLQLDDPGYRFRVWEVKPWASEASSARGQGSFFLSFQLI